MNPPPPNLPPGWTIEHSRKQNRPYYFHAETNTSKWNLDDVIPPPPAKRLKPAQPKVAIIVPYRDDPSHARSAQLAKFIPHMNTFLSSEAHLESFRLYIIEQGDSRKFNRGKLLNAGFLLASAEGYDSFIFHDVDLLPQPALAEFYASVPDPPIHIAKCWSRYNSNPEYLGGIVTFSRPDFEAIRGFPCIYWGWGGEDDELKKRVDAAHLVMVAPPANLPEAIVDLENKTLEEKLGELRAKKDEKCTKKWEAHKAHDDVRAVEPKPRWWGLPMTYDVIKRQDDEHTHSSVVRVDVQLNFEDDGRGHWTNQESEFKGTRS